MKRRYRCPYCYWRCWTLRGVLRHIRKCPLGRELYEGSPFAGGLDELGGC